MNFLLFALTSFLNILPFIIHELKTRQTHNILKSKRMKLTKVVTMILAFGLVTGNAMMEGGEERKIQQSVTGEITGTFTVFGYLKNSCTDLDYTKIYTALDNARDCSGTLNNVELSGDAGPIGTRRILLRGEGGKEEIPDSSHRHLLDCGGGWISAMYGSTCKRRRHRELDGGSGDGGNNEALEAKIADDVIDCFDDEKKILVQGTSGVSPVCKGAISSSAATLTVEIKLH